MAAAGGTTTTDTLVTEFKATGLAAFLGSTRNASRAILGLAAASAQLGQYTYPLFFAFFRASVGVQAMATAAFLLTGIIGGLARAFAPFEQDLIRLDVALAHTNLNLTVDALRQYAEARATATGIDADATIQLAEQLVTLKFTREQILALIPALQDAAALRLGGQTDPIALARDIAQAVQSRSGRPELLTRLGLDANAILRATTAAGRFNEILKEIIEKTGGGAEFLSTPFTRLAATFHNLLYELGNFLQPLINIVTNALQGWVLLFGKLTTLRDSPTPTGQFIRGFLDTVTGGRQTDMDHQRVQDAARRNNWQKTTADTLSQIEANTKKTAQAAETLAIQSLGNVGPRTLAEVTLRNLSSALG